MTLQIASWFGGVAMLALAPFPASAQQAVPPPAAGLVPRPTPTADKLAEAMRTLAANPRDLEALIAAADASAQLDDGPAALQFLARAERVRAGDPRIAAIHGSALARMGRPGEALRHFAAAERGGLPPAGYASDRGLAYDLIGDQPRAQMEYARALAAGDEPETRRRYAISLAIGGDSAAADRILDPLLRQQDRASWRTRALVMALSGNSTGAEKVTATMMPGFSTAYLPLFRRLSEIRDPGDRAFAAHLGEFTRTPARIADAALAPPAPALPQSATAPVAVARQEAPTTTADRGASTGARRQPDATSQRRTREVARRTDNTDRAGGRTERARAPVAAATRMAQADTRRSTPAPAPEPAAPVSSSRAEAARAPSSNGSGSTPVASSPFASTAQAASATRLVASATTPRSSISPASSSPMTARPANVGTDTARPGASPPTATAGSPAASTVATPARATAAPATRPATVGREDNVLAAIVRNIAIPGSELGVGPPPPPPPPPAPPPVVETPPVAAPPKEEPAPKPAPTKPVEAKKPEPKKTEAKKPAPKKAAPKPPAEPARWWVQVAGGANVDDLPKAWDKRVAKSSALKGRQAWTAPLRFTHRLLTGPFKSADEAQAFVNKLAGDGQPAFTYQSEEGQKITKLSAK